MKLFEHWWAISEEGRVIGQSPRKIWLTNTVMQKICKAAFILSFLTIILIWYLFAYEYMPQFKTKEQILALIRSVSYFKNFAVGLLICIYIFNYMLYNNKSTRMNPDVLIFAPKSFSEILRTVIVIVQQIIYIIVSYFFPIILMCCVIAIFNIEAKL